MAKKPAAAICIENDVIKKKYRIITLNGKIDHLQICDVDYDYKSEYQRWDLKAHKDTFKKVLYFLAKHQPEKFKLMYNELKVYDDEFFEDAEYVLKKIKAEYNYE